MNKLTGDHVFIMILLDDEPSELTLNRINSVTSISFFDPVSPKNKIQLCDFCKVFYNMMRVIQDRNRGRIFSTHEKVKEPGTFKRLVEWLKERKNVYKVYLLSLQSFSQGESPSIIANQIEHQKLQFNEFKSIIDNEEFKEKFLYEILMTT